MNYLFLAISAYLLNAVSVTIDKILLVKNLPNPGLYVFYISLFSLLVLFAAPFTTFPAFEPLAVSFLSIILWTLGAYFMFRALKDGEASRVIPVIGTLIPVILLFMQGASGNVLANEIFAVLLLVSGLIFLILPYLKGKISRHELILELVSALLFANSYFLLKIAYNSADFFSVFVYSRLILIPWILIIVLIPFLRKRVLGGHAAHPKVNFFSKTGALLFIGQAVGGASHLILMFSVSLANPAVINSIQGVQYVFLFILSLLLAKKFPMAFSEKYTRVGMFGKVVGILLIFFGLWVLALGEIKQSPMTGVTFSSRYARELGLNPDEAYQKTLTELQPKILRLPVYWDEVEKNMDQYDFYQTEKYLTQAQQNKTDIILVVGFKQPRWPECFDPDWSRNLSRNQFDQKIYELVKKEVETFKRFENIKYWQVENEPFVDFGICPGPNSIRLSEEIRIVKELDSRPVLITDSGELSPWLQVFNKGDVFGSTMYRVIWSPFFGQISYPIPPVLYTIKANIAKTITGNFSKPSMISELQAEPWPNNHLAITELPLEKQIELFPPERLVQNYNYASQSNLGPVIFWGVEWWYYMKLQNNPSYWFIAKMILEN